MKILAITASASYGGGPQHLFELLSHFDENICVDIASPRQEPFWGRFKAATSGHMFEIPERRFSLFIAMKLVAHTKRRGVEIVHSHGKGAGVYGRFVSAVTGLPLVHTPHGIHVSQYGWLMSRIYILYEKMTGFYCNSLIFVSESERKRAEELKLWEGVPQNVIYNGVRSWANENISLWRESVRKKRNILEDDVVIVTLSRFDYAKNMLEMAKIAGDNANFYFWFLGGGEDLEKVKSFCEYNSIKNIWFSGYVSNPEFYLAGSDVYLSTSRWEGLPLSILEAMSVAVPIVASDVVGNRDAVKDGETGYLYALGDIKEVSDHLRCLGNNNMLRFKMGEAGNKWQKRVFSVDKMASQTMAVYRELLVAS